MFKMPFATNHFNANQKVWVRSMTGALACLVVGRYRGKGRYVTAWVNYDSNSKPDPEIKEIEVDDGFAASLQI